MLKGLIMASGYVILSIVYGGKNVKERNFSLFIHIALATITCLWIFPLFFLITGSYKSTIEMIGAILLTASYPIAIAVWAIIVRSKDKKEKDNTLPTATELNNETNHAEENKPEDFGTEITEHKDNNYKDIPQNNTNTDAVEEAPQEKTEEVMQTENIAPLSYKDQKKAARTEYREKKKHLKEEHTNKANKGFKIATFILSFVLLISVTANIFLCVRVSELEIDILEEKASKEYYQDQHNDLTEYTNNLLSKHKQIKDELEDYQEIIYKYYNNIPLTKYEEHRARIAAFWGAEENQ